MIYDFKIDQIINHKFPTAQKPIKNMSTQYKQQQRYEDARYEDLDLQGLGQISDDDIAQFLNESEKVEKPESIWNLPTMAGISTIAVGLVYLLQQMGLSLFPGSLAGLVSFFTSMAGILIVLFGFGILSWKPKKNQAAKTIGKKDMKGATQQNYGNTQTAAYNSGAKSLMKSQTNKKVAGVCGGIAEYFGLDATLVRIAFVASIFIIGGFTVPIYLILAAVLPKNRNYNPPPSNPRDRITIDIGKDRENDRIRITRD